MTREEAIGIILGTAFRKKGPDMVELLFPPEPMIDMLVALGVLKLDEPVTALRCEPPPEHRDKPWHWLERSKDGFSRFIGEWDGQWCVPGTGVAVEPDHAAHCGCRYVAPCEEPTSAEGENR